MKRRIGFFDHMAWIQTCVVEFGKMTRLNDIGCIYTIYGYGSHLGHVANIMLINFHFLVPKKLQTKFG